MKIEQYLQIGAKLAPAVIEVFEEAGQLLHDKGPQLLDDASNLLDEAEEAFNDIKTYFTHVPGSDAGKHIADFTANLTSLYANIKQLLGEGEEAEKALVAMARAGEAQLKLLVAQKLGGNDVTAQPKA